MPFLHSKLKNLLVGKRGGKVSSIISTSQTTDKYWRFISPEVCFNGEKMESLFKDNMYIS
jgi:hypothetical protein